MHEKPEPLSPEDLSSHMDSKDFAGRRDTSLAEAPQTEKEAKLSVLQERFETLKRNISDTSGLNPGPINKRRHMEGKNVDESSGYSEWSVSPEGIANQRKHVKDLTEILDQIEEFQNK